mmetsp:Transcript_44673/g.96037  ORF Transcript_44673/g.96037 Transcript_44673/m.96037 type:complete len:623 (-) Transcript_44673:68-1936(-)
MGPLSPELSEVFGMSSGSGRADLEPVLVHRVIRDEVQVGPRGDAIRAVGASERKIIHIEVVVAVLDEEALDRDGADADWDPAVAVGRVGGWVCGAGPAAIIGLGAKIFVRDVGRQGGGAGGHGGGDGDGDLAVVLHGAREDVVRDDAVSHLHHALVTPVITPGVQAEDVVLTTLDAPADGLHSVVWLLAAAAIPDSTLIGHEFLAGGEGVGDGPLLVDVGLHGLKAGGLVHQLEHLHATGLEEILGDVPRVAVVAGSWALGRGHGGVPMVSIVRAREVGHAPRGDNAVQVREGQDFVRPAALAAIVLRANAGRSVASGQDVVGATVLTLGVDAESTVQRAHGAEDPAGAATPLVVNRTDHICAFRPTFARIEALGVGSLPQATSTLRRLADGEVLRGHRASIEWDLAEAVVEGIDGHVYHPVPHAQFVAIPLAVPRRNASLGHNRLLALNNLLGHRKHRILPELLLTACLLHMVDESIHPSGILPFLQLFHGTRSLHSMAEEELSGLHDRLRSRCADATADRVGDGCNKLAHVAVHRQLGTIRGSGYLVLALQIGEMSSRRIGVGRSCRSTPEVNRASSSETGGDNSSSLDTPTAAVAGNPLLQQGILFIDFHGVHGRVHCN